MSLQDDFNSTLKRVGKLRRAVRAEPLNDTPKGTWPNPVARFLANEQLHLRGLARSIGTNKVAKQIAKDMQSAESWVREELDPRMDEDPLDPVGPILRDTQTHIRGCAAIIANARASEAQSPESVDEQFDNLFGEPEDVSEPDESPASTILGNGHAMSERVT